MPRMIFVNLPVTDLPRSRRFYEALGFVNNPRFTDDSAACMVWSEAIFVMLLDHPRWATFTDRPIAPPGSSEVALCLSCDSREEVAQIVGRGASEGGTADINPPQDHGFMLSRALGDPDGHVWELMWMDPAAVAGENEPDATTA